MTPMALLSRADLAARHKRFSSDQCSMCLAIACEAMHYLIRTAETVLEESSGGCALRWPGEPSLCVRSYAYGGNLYRVLFKRGVRAAVVCLPALVRDSREPFV